MSDRTNIAWTDVTWNPIRARLNGRSGWHCTRVSAGCENCYAEAMNLRLGTGSRYSAAEKPDLFLDLGVLAKPFHWRAARRVFVCSMSDLFYEQVPDVWIDRISAVIAETSQHQFQVLTKHANRLCEFMNRRPLLKNLWIGVSVENRKTRDRITMLQSTDAAIRFVSFEPLLEDIGSIRGLPHGGDDRPGKIDWVIVGGESGPNRRPCKVEWIRSIAEQCHAAEIPVFVKQDSALRPGQQGRIPDDLWALKQFPRN